jgi:hypothetical protein
MTLTHIGTVELFEQNWNGAKHKLQREEVDGKVYWSRIELGRSQTTLVDAEQAKELEFIYQMKNWI